MPPIPSRSISPEATVSDSSVDCGARSISSPMRSAIRSIKEVVRDCSDADIVAVLAETHMDPNEAAQRLLAQGNMWRKHQLKRKASANGYKSVMDNDEIMIPGTIYQTWLHDSSNLVSKRGRLIKDKVQDPFLDLIREMSVPIYASGTASHVKSHTAGVRSSADYPQ